MKKTQSTIHWGLVYQELVCLIGMGIGAFGIWYDSAVVLSAILLAISALCAIVLFVTQYHAVVYTEEEIKIRYFGGSLSRSYSALGEVKVSALFSVRLPLTVYYQLTFPKGGKRFFYMDGEILTTKKQRHLLLAHGVAINDADLTSRRYFEEWFSKSKSGAFDKKRAESVSYTLCPFSLRTLHL